MNPVPHWRPLVPGFLALVLAACGGGGGGGDGNGGGSNNGEPSLTSDTSATPPENQTDTGYTATATDPDGDAISFSIVGGADQNAFTIDTGSGALRFKIAPDFESPGSSDGDNVYVVDIGASDGDGGTDTLTVSVTVTDVDEGTGNNAPSFTSGSSASAPENQTDTGYTAAATDPDDDSVTYGLASSPDQGAFDIDTNSGALTFKSAPDFDSPGDDNSDNEYVVDITAKDGLGGITEHTVTITVTNVNEDPAFSSGASANTPENQTDTDYTATASDPDGDSISFSLVGGADQSAFNIGTSSGDLSFKTAPDFETPGSDDGDNVYEVTIRASDGSGGTDTQSVTITVTDVPEGGGSAGCYTDRAGSGSDPSTTTLEFFSGSLRAVDPGNPGATPQTVDADARTSPAPAPVLDGTWQLDGGITNPAVARVVYQDSSNHLYQVSTEIGSAVPARMSNENSAVDRFEVGHDYNNPANACIAYRLSSGSDWQMTRLGAGSATTPEDFPGVPIVAFNDNNSGAHDGWLTLDGGELKRISGDDGSLGSGLGGLSGTGSVDLIGSLPDGTAFLNIDGDLFAYEPSTDTLTDFGHFFPDNITIFEAHAPEFAVADDSQLYFTDEYNLYRTELPAGSVETLESFPGDAVKPADPEADRLAVTNTRVIWTYTSGSGVKIRSIVKSTGAASTLDTLPSGTNISTFNDNQTYLARSGQWFFYTALDSSSSQRTAVALRDNGSTEVTYADNRWTGANLNPRPGDDMGDALQQIYLLSGTDNAGETLQFVPAGSPSSNTTLGTLPADTTSNDDAFQLGGGIGTARLAQVSVGSGAGLETDILFVDTSTTTLTLATDDNSNDETPVALF